MDLKKPLLYGTLLLSATLTAVAQERPLWLRYPAISPDGKTIAFAYQGDIYTVPTSGGEARRLTSGSAYECHPVWSPDGRQIAFTSDRNSLGTNIYIMPATGGNARQLTTHSGTEIPQSFTPDGRYVVFKAHIQDPASSALFPNAILSELYRVPITGGRPEQILATPADAVCFSRDGRRILYQEVKTFENEWRKHHTSSSSLDLLEYDLEKKTYRFVARHDGEDRDPVYAPTGKSFYFLSERDGGSMNVYEANLAGPATEAKPLTKLSGDPVRFLSSSQDGLLCFGYAGEIYTLVPGAREQRVPVRIIKDSPEDEQLHLSMSRSLGSASVSPDGKQIAFTSRGDVFVTATDYTTTRQITQGSEANRGVTFGADNKSVVYASSQDGTWDLYLAKLGRSEDPNFPNAHAIKEEKLIPSLKGEKMYPLFSPDGSEVAFLLDRERLMVYNLKTRQTRQITDGSQSLSDYVWSPDGKWIAVCYVSRNRAPYTDIGIVTAEGGQPIHNLTNSGYFSSNPRWSSDGSILLYETDKYGMRNHASWGSMTDLMAIFLNREAYEKYRMNDEDLALLEEAEKKAKADTTKSKDKSPATGSEEAKSKKLLIEWDNIDMRTVRLTQNSSDYGDAILTADGKKLYYFAPSDAGQDLWVYDMRKKTSKLQKSLGLSDPFFASDKKGTKLFILGSSPMTLDPKTDATKAITMAGRRHIDRIKEREVMYEEVVREEAARFYRKDMHGVNWKQLTDHYRTFLPYIDNNQDFAEMLSELLGELNVSHTGARARSFSSAFPTAELGLFVSPVKGSGALLVDEIVAGGPFDTSRTKLQKGCMITAIEGVELREGQDYFPLLNDKVGKRLLVSFRTPAGEQHDEVIRPISSSELSRLLYQRWVKQRAAEVERISGGELGYVHIPSMGDPSFRTVYSDVLGKYYQKKGIVIDIRYNGGGRLHEDIEAFFTGTHYADQVVRGRQYSEMSSRRWNRPSVLVTCEADYSNAHGTPWVYQHLKVGKVVGMPVAGTMTSVNWVTLLDPSVYFGIPAVGFRLKDGRYLENTQMEPDVVVPLDPTKVLQGIDTQLVKAVEVLKAETK
jgi:putative peptidase/protease family protein